MLGVLSFSCFFRSFVAMIYIGIIQSAFLVGSSSLLYGLLSMGAVASSLCYVVSGSLSLLVKVAVMTLFDAVGMRRVTSFSWIGNSPVLLL